VIAELTGNEDLNEIFETHEGFLGQSIESTSEKGIVPSNPKPFSDPGAAQACVPSGIAERVHAFSDKRGFWSLHELTCT
jgi:hypothetical protein